MKKTTFFTMLLTIIICLSNISPALASDAKINDNTTIEITKNISEIQKEFYLVQELSNELDNVSFNESGTYLFEKSDSEGNTVSLEISIQPNDRWSIIGVNDDYFTGVYAGNWTATSTWTGTNIGKIVLYCNYRLYQGNSSSGYSIEGISSNVSATPPSSVSIFGNPSSNISYTGSIMAVFNANVAYSGETIFNNTYYHYFKIEVTLTPSGYNGVSLHTTILFDSI